MLSSKYLVAPAILVLVPVGVWAQAEAETRAADGQQQAASETASEMAASREQETEPELQEVAVPQTISPLREGDLHMARKEYREAIDAYTRGLRQAAVLYNKMGIAYQSLGDTKAAIEQYEKALKMDPTYSEAVNNIGTVYYSRRNYRRAIQQYEKALELSPDSASVYNNLSTAYYARKQYERSFAAMVMALRLDPGILERTGSSGSMVQERTVQERAQYYYLLSKAFAAQGMVDSALLYMRRALEDGFSDRDKFRTDPEFQALQENEQFQALLVYEPRVL